MKTSLTRNLFFLLALTVFAITSTILTIYNYDPAHASRAVFIDFYLSLFVALCGILSIAIYYLKMRKAQNETISKYFWPSIRQASFASLAIVILLYLQGLRILDWLVGISVIVVSILLELFFESKKSVA